MTKFGSLSLLVTLVFFGCGHAYATRSPNEAGATSQPATHSNNSAAASTTVDCSAAYGDKPATCKQISCPKQYRKFIGVWKGKFHAYVRKLSKPKNPVYRPYQESVAYKKSDCLKNIKTGETFIIGHETSNYSEFHDLPASTRKVMLILGKKADGTPLLRRVSKKGADEYTLDYKNKPAQLSIWKLSLARSKGQPAMTFTTIDAEDLTKTKTRTRDVAITLTVGPTNAPYWQGLIAYGSHTLQKK